MTTEQKKMKGFTLVELLVVIVIVLLMLVAGLPSMGRSNRASDYRNKVEELKGFWSQVYTLALNPQNTSISSYRIYFDAPSKNFKLLACTKNGTDPCPAASALVVRNVTLLSSNESINLSGGDWLVNCPTLLTGGAVVCTDNPAIRYKDPITGAISNPLTGTLPFSLTVFDDTDPSVNKHVKFDIPAGLFQIKVSPSQI